MKSSFVTLKGLLIRGIILLVPIIFIVFLIKTFLGILVELIRPIADLLPADSVFGLGMTELAAFVIFLIIVFVSGIFASTNRGSMLSSKFESLVPGFKIFKSILLGQQHMEDNKLKVCLATVDDAWLFGFIIEEHESGMLTIFIPAAPSPTSGNVYFMTEQQVKRLDIPAREAVKLIMQFGEGSKSILDKEVNW